MSIQQLAGQKLGQYELRELLGIGGMGAVYRGYQKNLKRAVAVKVLTPQLAQQSGYFERFNREAETAAALEHQHIIPIYDYGTERGVSYVVMRLLTGGTLADRLRQHTEQNKPMPSLGEIAEVLKQLGSALDYAHTKGVIHRDIKPSNVMFDNQGSAYLVDFGIAKLVEATQALTGAGMTMGTPLYMSPEQWRAEVLTPAADQYAVGVMAYSLITGRPPFEAATPFALMHKHLNEAPTPPQMFRHDVPDTVTQTLARAMAKNAGDRFPTVTAFAQAFEKAMSGHVGVISNFFTTPVPFKPPAPPPITGSWSGLGATYTPLVPPKPIYRSPVVWSLAAVIAVLIGVVGVMVLTSGGDGSSSRLEQTATSISRTLAAFALGPGESDTPVQMASDATSPTPTATGTETPTDSPPPSLTTTHTASPTPSSTTTDTDPPTATDTDTDPLTSMATDTPTPTETPTHTPTPTAKSPVEILTPTLTPTRTLSPTPTSTATATLTPTLTPTRTLTPTPTPTETPSLTPSPTPADALPTIEPIPNQTLGAGASVELDIYASDPEGAPFGDAGVESLDPDVAFATVTRTETLAPSRVHWTVQIVARAPGNAAFAFFVTDAAGQRAKRSFRATVLDVTPTPTTEAPNRNPVVEVIPDQHMFGGESINVPFSASDPDGDTLTMLAQSDNLAIATAVISEPGVVTVTASASGIATIIIFIEDGRGGNADTLFRVTVEAGNSPPVIGPLSDQTLTVGQTRDVFFTTSDPDGDPLTSVAMSDNESVAEATVSDPGLVYLAGRAPGSATITVTVDDGRGGVSVTTFAVTVTAIPPTETSVLTATPGADGCIRYTVQTGDTLFAIALTYGVSPDDLILANGFDENHVLQVGEVLIIPIEGCAALSAPTPVALASPCRAADVNGNGTVDIFDIRTVAASYNSPISPDTQAFDLDGNGQINILDLRRITSQYGQGCE